METRPVLFIVEAKRWFDKANGNTYHACKITRVSDGAVLLCPFQYGYGNHYQQTSLEKMAAEKWLPEEYCSEKNMYRYEFENNYPIKWVVSDGTKRETVALGLGG